MNRSAFPLAAATTAAIFVLLIVGGTVNPTGSSLACPDWPTCHGSFFPAMKNGVEFEHTHRLVATAVGLMAIALAWSLWTTKPRNPGLRLLGAAAVGMVVIQGVLGGLTVLFRLPLGISASHLALSMLVFCYFLFLTFRLWPGRTHAHSVPNSNDSAPAARWPAAVAAVVVYGQILLGALVRHMHAGRACNDDFPWCGGAIWPAWGPAQLHMVHRFGAIVTVIVVLVASFLTWRTAHRHSRKLAARLALTAPVLVTVQVLLGVLTVTSSIGVVEATAHLGVGALLLADFVAIFLALGARIPAAALDSSASIVIRVPPQEALS